MYIFFKVCSLKLLPELLITRGEECSIGYLLVVTACPESPHGMRVASWVHAQHPPPPPAGETGLCGPALPRTHMKKTGIFKDEDFMFSEETLGSIKFISRETTRLSCYMIGTWDYSELTGPGRSESRCRWSEHGSDRHHSEARAGWSQKNSLKNPRVWVSGALTGLVATVATEHVAGAWSKLRCAGPIKCKMSSRKCMKMTVKYLVHTDYTGK